MKHLAFLTTAVVYAGLIAAHTLASQGRALVMKPQATVAAVYTNCRGGLSWDATKRTCVPVKPRGSF